MANKTVPDVIEGVALHQKAKARTSVLLADLEALGVSGLSAATSAIDRIRLLASYIYENAGVTDASRTEESGTLDPVDETVVEELAEEEEESDEVVKGAAANFLDAISKTPRRVA